MVRTVLSTLLIMLLLAVQNQQAPVEVERYHEKVPPGDVPLSPAETELGEQVRKAFSEAGRRPPEYDPNIALACRQLCRVLDCSDMDAVQAWEPQTIQFTLRRLGITDSFYFPVVARVEAMDEAGELLRDLVSDELRNLDVNRFGLALDLEDSRMFAAVFTRRLVQLGPFPREVEPGSTHLLWGALLQNSRKPLFILATPEGGTLQQSPHESNGILWNQVYFPEQAGQYEVELLVQRDGPQVASLFPVYVGTPVPARPVFKLYPGVDETADLVGLERQVVELVNRERSKRQLVPCELDTALEKTARAYSQTMADAGRLSHALTRHDGALETDYTENISLSTSLHAAHANLMASPSHRRNILDEEVRYCGVGVVAVSKGDSGRLLYITQRFSRTSPSARQVQQSATPPPASLR